MNLNDLNKIEGIKKEIKNLQRRIDEIEKKEKTTYTDSVMR